MELKDIEMRPNRKASLKTRSLDEWLGEYVVIDYGMIMLCREARLTSGRTSRNGG